VLPKILHFRSIRALNYSVSKSFDRNVLFKKADFDRFRALQITRLEDISLKCIQHPGHEGELFVFRNLCEFLLVHKQIGLR